MTTTSAWPIVLRGEVVIEDSLSVVLGLLDIERSAAHRRLRTAEEKGYVTNAQDKRGRPAQYVTADAMPESRAVLPEPGQLCTPACAQCQDNVSAGQPCTWRKVT